MNADQESLRKPGPFKARFVSSLVFILYRLLKFTWKFDIEFDEISQKAFADPLVFKIVAHFHEDEWGLIPHFEGTRMHVLVSLSEDGSILASLLKKIGYQITRGSSSRGAVAGLLGLIRSLRKSDSRLVSIAVDGPKGPRRKIKPGIFKICEAVNAQIVGFGVFCSDPWVFRKSWSHGFLPKPFSKIVVRALAFDDANSVKKALDEGRIELLSEQLVQKLLSAKSLAKTSLQ